MRVLCSITGSVSHGRASLPLVRALAGAGHEVLVVTGEKLAPVFDGEAARTVGVLTDITEQGLRLLMAGKLPIPREFSRFAHDLWAPLACGPQILDPYELLLPIARDFRPDVILRDGFEFGAMLVAERLGVPHVSAPSGSGQFMDPAAILPMLDDRRREVGLPATGDPLSIYRHGRLDCMPAAYSFARPAAPEAVAYQQPRNVARGEAEPPWLADLPPDRPLVIASLGTGLPGTVLGFLDKAREINPAFPVYDPAEPLNTLVTALSMVDCTAVVSTLGMPLDRSLAAANVLVVDRFPQPLLLEHAALFVSHGGYNSVREATRTGVPTVVRPMYGDQRYNAERVQELGLGVHVPAREPDVIAKACQDVLDDPLATAEPGRARAAMLALPGIETAVAYLETLGL